MRADLEMFRERIDERRARDEAAVANRGRTAPTTDRGRTAPVANRGRTAPVAAMPPPRSSALDDDDEYYRPRSWLV
ncbi:hypothetical protein [Rhodococcus opacus]|uniref:Uncharacterized protein n=1 Tax=Rhodococcus opacus (strain B4) TaxID=632772 RepID=C1B061_RHOOB|nr:hypothetical protein [Rhodococcus opacus]BAH54482.1 hypothetical protein ROP_62350 [Rhodococcus opacus B4]